MNYGVQAIGNERRVFGVGIMTITKGMVEVMYWDSGYNTDGNVILDGGVNG